MHFEPIERAAGSDKRLLELLRGHPRVTEVLKDASEKGLRFERQGYSRHISIGDASEPLRGLVELLDNNPLVCTDRFSVPDAAATLALIALGPLAEAGLILEAPIFISNLELNEARIDAFLSTAGWHGGVNVSSEVSISKTIGMATAMASIRTPENLEELDALYEERYGRSFYVRLADESSWNPSTVEGQPYALYRLRISVDEGISILTIQVLADVAGKCGAAQIVHAMNVMCGFEETLGLERAYSGL